MTTANNTGGMVFYSEDNLTDITENVFKVTQQNDVNTALLQQIVELLTNINTNIQTPNIKSQQNIPQPSVQNNYIEQSGREKLSKKLLATADWITANDPDLKLSVRQVATSAKVSIGTAQAAIKLITDERSK